MMESKTNVLLDKVTTHKAALDDHYPNWREKANMFVAPNYISQENIFNMLDSLRCRLNTNYDSNLPAPKTEVNFNSGESLAAMLDPQFTPTTAAASKSASSPRKSAKNTPRSPSPQKDQVLPVISERSAPSSVQAESPPKPAVPSFDPTAETLTQITESGDVSLKLAEDDNIETEDTISPRPLFSYQPAARVATGFEESESSEGGVEDMLSPQKIAAKSADTTRDRNPSADSRASVDTVIKNPITVTRTTPTRLATLTSQMSHGDTETESTAPIYNTPSTAPGKRKTALDLLNESSESEAVQAAVPKNKESEDSEDDFDFFD
eukprot:sb/3466808/